MVSNNPLIEKVEDFVFQLFKTADTSKLLYHNFNHTHSVVKAAIEIGEGSKISKNDLETLTIAAWFHDVGYTKSHKKHEEISTVIAIAFLDKESYPSESIDQVKACILATCCMHKPITLLQEIIKDADLKSIGSKDYSDNCVLLRTEQELLTDKVVPEAEWLKKEIEFLGWHQYNTKYAQLTFNGTKFKNLIHQKNELKKLEKKSQPKTDSLKDNTLKLKEQELKLKIKKADSPERGIETMFRTALKNHMTLSAIADNKANIMLSINALILSILITDLSLNLEEKPQFLISSIVMLLTCLISIILATLSTKPKITVGKFSTEDVKARKSNLLFFGNFHNMQLSDFEWGMKEMMGDKDYLYSSLTKDLYFLGVVLAKKYKFLRLCYTVFMIGMILSVVLAGIALGIQSGVIG